MIKKIALVGNMNNNFFSIARHLRDNGMDAHLFYNGQILGSHFHPAADTMKLSDLDFVHDVNWFVNSFYDGRVEQVRKDLEGYDIFIAQGDEAALLNKAGFPIHVYYPYGSDIYKYVWLRKEFKTWEVLAAKWLNRPKITLPYEGMKDGTMSKFLHHGIQHAKHVFWDHANAEVDKKLMDIGLKGKLHRVPMPFIYPDTYRAHFSSSKNSDTHWASEIDRLRASNDFLLLYHGRQEWKTIWNDFTNKNTHHLIYGFAEFLKEKPKDLKAHLIMLQYGGDWKHSVQLVHELGIDSYVTWLPKMLRKDLFYVISQMDLCSGEFDRSYVSFGTIMEAMCMGKPVISYRDDRLYQDNYPELYPMVNAREIEEVKNQLLQYSTQKEILVEMGKKAQTWVDKYFIDGPVQELVKTVKEYL